MGTATRARIEVFSTSDALAQAAADRFVSAANDAIQKSGRFTVAQRDEQIMMTIPETLRHVVFLLDAGNTLLDKSLTLKRAG